MQTIIRGKYRDGRIELAEDPKVAGEAAVLVTFLDTPPNTTLKQQIMTAGMLAVPGRKMSTEEDFKIAEFDDFGWENE